MAENGRDWKRLGKYVVQARVEAGYPKRPSFVEAIKRITGTAVTDRTIGNLERGTPVSDNTIAAVELTLGWAPGSGEAILRGGEPTKRAPKPRRPASDSDGLRSSLKVMRRAMGHDAFMQWVDEVSAPDEETEGEQPG